VGGWRRLHNEELHNLYALPSIIKSDQVKSMDLVTWLVGWSGRISSIEVDLRDVGCRGVRCIELVHDSIHHDHDDEFKGSITTGNFLIN
jgi:hypothetical protein